MKTIPVLAGLLIIAGGILAGVGAVQYQTSRQAMASENFAPSNLKITNVSDTGFSVSWITNVATAGYVVYGEMADNLQLKTVDDRDKDQNVPSDYFIHYVSILGLKPGSWSYFKVGSGKSEFGLGEENFKVQTGVTITDQPAADAAYGQVVTENNDPAEGAVVYLQVPGAGLLSSLTKPSGAFAIPVSGARSEGLDKFVKLNKDNDLISVWVENGSLGSSSAAIPASMLSPIPNLTLGKIYDFSTMKTNNSTPVESKFENEKVLLPTNVSLLSPFENEAIATEKPVIIGKAPPGTIVSIEVNSEEVIKTEVTADDLGNFSFQVPNNLAEGEHTVTITSTINGVLKTIKKSFVVSAQTSSSPFYTATPSATLRPSPSPTRAVTPSVTPRPTLIALAPTVTVKLTTTVKPTASPTLLPSLKPTATVKPTATIKPSATPKPTSTPVPTMTPRPTPTATEGTAEIPKSGTPMQTGILALLGASLALVGYTLGNEKKKVAHRV